VDHDLYWKLCHVYNLDFFLDLEEMAEARKSHNEAAAANSQMKEDC